MEYRIVRSILFVVPGREIDHFQAETIIRYTEGLLRQQCFRLLVFDLADTVFMDSAGVGMMIGLYREIRAWGGAVYIIRMQSGVRRIYRMAGLHKIIPCYEDEAQFLAAVEGGGAGDKMRLTMNAIAENEYFARVTVAAFSAKMDPTMEELSDIKTAVSEAVTNAVVHGYDGKGGSVEIRAEIQDEWLEVEIEDEGIGMDDVELAMEPLYTSRPETNHAGMGFTFMEAFMDELEVTSTSGQGTKVKMRKKIERPAVLRSKKRSVR